MCRELENRINRVHERCLLILYNDKKSNFKELLDRDENVTIHQRNIQTLAIEMYKVFKENSPHVFSNLFIAKENSYNLRNESYFVIPKVNSVFNGTESISYLGPKIWNIVPDDIKALDNVSLFKRAIKKWVPENCPCRICKIFLPGVGFI